MRSVRGKLLLLTVVALSATGCATGEEWNTWYTHRTHFASYEHMGFSVRNTEGSSPKVTRQDIALARDEGWWGKPITVSQEQILER
jgi:hypothetical protein